MMGIPLLLVSLVSIGKYFSGVWDRVLARFAHKRMITSKHNDIYSTVILTIFGLIAVVFIPAAIFQKIEENWSYAQAVYFAIVSLTTIGLGDFTPDQDHLEQPHYILLYLTWLFIGLAVVSVLVTKLSKIYTRLNRSIIVMSTRCFNKCFRVKRYHLLTNTMNNTHRELNTL